MYFIQRVERNVIWTWYYMNECATQTWVQMFSRTKYYTAKQMRVKSYMCVFIYRNSKRNHYTQYRKSFRSCIYFTINSLHFRIVSVRKFQILAKIESCIFTIIFEENRYDRLFCPSSMCKNVFSVWVNH